MMDFSQGAGQDGPSNLIPNGQLAWVIMSVRGVKGSQTGGQYVDVELTIDEGQPYARKKVWDKIADPSHPGNSDDYKAMGMRSIARILETAKNAGPHNPGGYQLGGWPDLNGLRVAIKIGIEKGKDGYEDKNRVAEYLTPNPQSSAHKDFQRLMAGEYNKAKPAAAPAQQAAFGGFVSQQAQPAAAPAGNGWGAQPAAGGFQQPQAEASPAPTAANQWSGSGTANSATTSPSDAPSGWLAQANGQA